MTRGNAWTVEDILTIAADIGAGTPRAGRCKQATYDVNGYEFRICGAPGGYARSVGRLAASLLLTAQRRYARRFSTVVRYRKARSLIVPADEPTHDRLVGLTRPHVETVDHSSRRHCPPTESAK